MIEFSRVCYTHRANAMQESVNASQIIMQHSIQFIHVCIYLLTILATINSSFMRMTTITITLHHVLLC